MSEIPSDFDTSAETFQEGTTPVQAFTSAAIRVLPGMALQPCRGRPARIRGEPRQDEENVVGA